jgi:hypothetical protein
MYIHVLIEIYFLAEHICLLKGDEPISLPVVPDTHTLVHFNVMFAHLFNVLSKSQAMSLYEINPVKTLTIEALVNGFFPAIKATDNEALPFVGPRTVAYVHALIIDTVTVLQAESPNAEALRNEAMLRQELEKMKPAVMRKQLQRCFEAYYEDILKIRGASGRPNVSVYKRKFDEVLEADQAEIEEGEPGHGEGAPAIPAAADGAGGEDAGPAATAAAAADAPASSKGRKGRAGGR